MALVHRPKYDDWSFPKGKLLPGEHVLLAAVREVAEETGLVCELGDEVGSVYYTDRHGRPKVVRYWLMTVCDGEFTPNNEVSELRWLSPPDAAEQLSFDRDREILARL